MASVHRLVLAVADGPNSRGIDPDLGQRLAQGQRAAFAERAVVFPGAALVAVAFNEQFGIGIGLQRPGDTGNVRLFSVQNHRAVKIEMHRVSRQLLAVNIHGGEVSPVGGRGNGPGHVWRRRGGGCGIAFGLADWLGIQIRRRSWVARRGRMRQICGCVIIVVVATGGG